MIFALYSTWTAGHFRRDVGQRSGFNLTLAVEVYHNDRKVQFLRNLNLPRNPLAQVLCLSADEDDCLLCVRKPVPQSQP